MKDLPEPELLRLAQGDPGSEMARRAASELLSHYQEKVYAWCYRHLRDPQRAMDLAQEVLLSSYRNIGAFEGRSRFSSWLFAITRNRCLSELRRPSLLTDEDADIGEHVSTEADPAQALIEKYDEEELLGLIRDHLEPREQEVLWLRCFERMPVPTINRTLGIGQASGARGILQTARRKLRAALVERQEAALGGES